jgi:predicted nucleic acid-binding protein
MMSMYLDTCLVVKLYIPERESECVQRIVSGKSDVNCSELVITEFGSALSRKCREDQLSRSDQDRIWRLFTEHIHAGYWNLIPISRDITTRSYELIVKCQNKCPLRTLDAIHLATCEYYSLSPLYTADQVMLKAAYHLGISIGKLEPGNRK